MIRLALGIEYCGRDFNGWQTQADGRTVQQVLEAALSKVANQDITVQCAGRTDTGVHALNQVVHFDTPVERDMYSWLLGGNSNLPHDVNIHWALPVEQEFHARFSALHRSYRYIILNHSARSALLHKKVTWEARALDIERMIEASKCLIGEHDFTSYRAIACQAKSPVRTVHELSLRRRDNFIIMDIRANAFLHHMVRNIAGVLMEIGMAKQEAGWAKQVLQAKDRTLGGMTAAADGLYFVEVQYPEQFAIRKANASQWPMCL